MGVELTWLEQRIALLKSHIRELKELSSLEKQTRTGLLVQQGQERNELFNNRNNSSVMAAIVTQHTHQLTELSIHFSSERTTLLARQKQEELKQAEQIDLERDDQSKPA
ncbi:hypothetical protein [Spirosoma pollinicola]|uniref:Uncharacterized protein n=1 Tax=Spirosoma pollinicola TaxID=2057025 RepID=A0A2K8Z0Q2_9BACT|nr:hypothetical protein [Spirosoma pollinicola]AUD03441.1 hypothetical protein CWM47_17330 [Spirosoma pollinicola]